MPPAFLLLSRSPPHAIEPEASAFINVEQTLALASARAWQV